LFSDLEGEALEALQFHAGTHPAIEDARWVNGFLGSLRPYRGALRHQGFHEVMAALRVLAPRLRHDPIDRVVLSSALSIAHLGRAWGVEPQGMLRSNGLISDTDVETLSEWVSCVLDTVTLLLDDADDDVAFESYRLYCEDNEVSR
jgi:hypothetical protein